jgi:hypothetical protein
MKNNVPAGQNVGRKFVLHVQWRAVGTQCGTRFFLTIPNIFYTPPLGDLGAKRNEKNE